jgi:hypothetical protein
MIIILLTTLLFQVGTNLILWYKFIRTKKQKECAYYIDYRKGNTILRVFKPFYEGKVISEIPLHKILDRGTLNQYYLWVLIEM